MEYVASFMEYVASFMELFCQQAPFRFNIEIGPFANDANDPFIALFKLLYLCSLELRVADICTVISFGKSTKAGFSCERQKMLEDVKTLTHNNRNLYIPVKLNLR